MPPKDSITRYHAKTQSREEYSLVEVGLPAILSLRDFASLRETFLDSANTNPRIGNTRTPGAVSQYIQYIRRRRTAALRCGHEIRERMLQGDLRGLPHAAIR